MVFKGGNLMNKKNQKLIIAGPCAAESYQQVTLTAKALKKIGVTGFRASLWKPRTKPGFDGVGGNKGIPWLAEIAKEGLLIATEVLIPKHALQLVKQLVRKNQKSQFIFWIGARNQNHLIQRGIARVLKNEKSVYLMIKNQIWYDEKHWLGIYEHVKEAGFPEERILICHRGFAPNGYNPKGLRNIPDYKMAMRVKKLTGRQMILDPSHIGGKDIKVIEIVKESLQYDFDGYLIEVHPNPQNALTDASQQLTIEQLKKLLKQIRIK